MSNLDSSSYQDRLNYLLSRYEQSRLDGDTVYFDVEELEMIIDYYLDQQLIEEASGAIELGMAIHPANTLLKIQ